MHSQSKPDELPRRFTSDVDDDFEAPNRTIVELPKRVVRLQARRQHRQEERNRQFHDRYGVQRNKANVVISAKIPGMDLSHYAGQRYDLSLEKAAGGSQHLQRGELRLIADGWYKTKSRGQAFTINQTAAHRKKNWMDRSGSADDDQNLIRQYPDFYSLLPDDAVWTKLSANLAEKMGIVKPTLTQLKAIKPALTGCHVYVAAETGCGKTLCYALPLLHRLVNSQQSNQSGTRAVILVPSHELANQVVGVICTIAAELCPTDETSPNITVGTEIPKRTSENEANVSQPPDVLVNSPNRVADWLAAGDVDVDSLHMAIVDEADTLLDDSFAELTAKVISQLSTCDRPRPVCQVVLASATLTSHLDEALASIGLRPDDVTLICSDQLGYIQHTGSRHRFLRVTRAMKPDQLLSTLRPLLMDNNKKLSTSTKSSSKVVDKPSIMIFVNRTDGAHWLAEFLNRSGYDCVLLSGRLSSAQRQANFAAFRDRRAPILVCTDVSSRGIDITTLSHVINFDFPPHLVDYIHRAGRVGRVNQKGVCGTIITFVQRGWEVQHVAAIEKSIRLGEPLRELETNTTHLAVEHKQRKQQKRAEKTPEE